MIGQATAALVVVLATTGVPVAQSVGSAADLPDPPGGLVLCLYAVAEPTGPRGAGSVSGLRLQYLITSTSGPAQAQEQLWLAASALRSHPVLAVPGHRARVLMRNTTGEERHHVWAAVSLPARLALFYDVEVAPAEQ